MTDARTPKRLFLRDGCTYRCALAGGLVTITATWRRAAMQFEGPIGALDLDAVQFVNGVAIDDCYLYQPTLAAPFAPRRFRHRRHSDRAAHIRKLLQFGPMSLVQLTRHARCSRYALTHTLNSMHDIERYQQHGYTMVRMTPATVSALHPARLAV